MEEKIIEIKQNLKTIKDMQKSYVDQGRIQKEFKISEHVFLKVKPKKSSLKLGSWTKLATIFCGPFEMLDRIGPVTHMFAFISSMTMHNVFHVSLLKNHVHDPNHFIDWTLIQVELERDFEV